MKGLGAFAGVEHADIRRAAGRSRLEQSSRVECREAVRKWTDCAEGVNARVGPTAGVGGSRRAGQLVQRILEHLLNRSQTRLALPAVKVGAVVGECELDVPHRAGVFCRSNVGGHELEKLLGDLHGVGGGSLAQIVGNAPEQEGVGSAEIAADAADENVVLAGGRGGQRIAAAAPGRQATVTPGDRDQISRACSGEIGLSVSIMIDSLCENGTGTRTQVGLTSIEGSPMIFRVSFTIFISSLL